MRQLFFACGFFGLIIAVSLSARGDDAGGPCNAPCDGPCASCHGADLGWPGAVNGTCALAPPGFVGSPSCAPAVCNGRSASCDVACINDSTCAAGYYCGGGNLGCVPKKAQGEACGANCGESGCPLCASDHCVDGLCCDTACDGACVACSAVAKGAGADGICGPVATGGNGRIACGHEPAGSCGLSGVCDGNGHCALHPAMTVCAPPVCIVSQAWTFVCDGNGACTHNPVDCSPLGCDTAGTACAPCDGGACDAGAPDATGGDVPDVAGDASHEADALSSPDVSSDATLFTDASHDGGACSEDACGGYVCRDGACLVSCASIDDCAAGNVCRPNHTCGPFEPAPEGGCALSPNTRVPGAAGGAGALLLAAVCLGRRARRAPRSSRR